MENHIESKDREKIERLYRKLRFFYEEKIPIHFKLIKNGMGFRNGTITKLNRETGIMILKENMMGEIPFALEDLNENSIVTYIQKWEKD